MKITDFALIFIGIMLPIIIIVYVNVSYTIKAEEQEMYYNKIINLATQDASDQMKEVESDDKEIDYGYSGLQNNKISINPEIAKDTFLTSLYNNFGIKGNVAAEQYLQTFIPAIAIIDYNGVYISSQERYNQDGQTIMQHVVKPKKYFSYTYSIMRDKSNPIKDGIDSNADEVHTVEFTMDDYVTHRASSTGQASSFYLNDSQNNSPLLSSTRFTSRANVISYLEDKRKEVIVNTITKEITNAVNDANAYAKSIGITYDFVFPTITQDEMANAITNPGVFAFVQGINYGSKYLNAKSYSMSKLEETNKYYFSVYNSASSVFLKNLYHKDEQCSEYLKGFHNGDSFGTEITPTYVITKQQAASARLSFKTRSSSSSILKEGFYPCPICRP